MVFDVRFQRSDQVDQRLHGALPEFVGDYGTDIMEVCSILAGASAGEFVLAGFGCDRWPLDVAYDMSAFMEGLPKLIDGVRSGTAVEVDLYSQGIESLLAFEPAGSDVVIRCVPYTDRSHARGSEVIGRRELVVRLEDLAKSVATGLHEVAPSLADEEPFNSWLRGEV